jgi:uncharacterized protein (TIGR04255 family)
MVKSFEMPPLVELIAELRWIPGGVKVAANDPNGLEIQPSVFLNPRADELYMQFAGIIGAHGYTQIERLVPAGFPSMPFTPIYRYREGGSPQGPTLYQLGLGIFSANTTPPYKSWTEFRPVVEQGVQALLRSLGKEGGGTFSSVVLRYIDGFTPLFTGSLSMDRFLRDALGVTVVLPTALTSRIAQGSEIRPRLQVAIPLGAGMNMSMALGEGRANGQEAVIMDTSVSAGQPVPANLESVMVALDAARTIIHDTFIELTSKLHKIMKPIDGA